MGAAEVIAFEEVRARKQWSTLRQQLHERFDQWLDTLEQRWHEPPSTLTEATATVWDLRQQLTGGITETIVAQGHRREHDRTEVACSRCTGVLRARELVCRTVETMVGPVQLGPPGANDRFFTVRRSSGRISSCLPYRTAFKNKRIRETSPERDGIRWDIS